MSLGNLQYHQQPQQQQQQQHPLLAAISGNNYALGQQQRAAHLYHPLRPLLGAGTQMHGMYAGGDSDGGHSGYGYEPTGGGSGYDYHPAAPAHMPSGGSYAYHSTAGATGYGAPPAAAAPARPSLFGGLKATGGGKKHSGQVSSSTMTALTLLAFFFFVNLLQNCLKDNMEAMNPTVMVMTANVVRNRFNKLAEMNSREHNTSPASTFSSGASIVVQPGDLVSAAASSLAAASTEPSVMLQSPYSGGAVNNHNTRKPATTHYHYNNNNNDNNNNNYNNNHNDDYNSHEQLAPSGINRDPRPEFYESAHSYPNHSLILSSNNDRRRHPYHEPAQHQDPHSYSQQQHFAHTADGSDHNDDRDQQHYSPAHTDASFSWSAHKRGPNAHSSSVWSSASLPAHISGNNYFDNDRHDDSSFYSRIN